jgi:flagellar hook-basal body complex protein FliE
MARDNQDSQFTVSDAITIAVLKEKLDNLEEQQQKAEAKLAALEKDRDNALRWGIMLLGTAVLSMGTWIFNRFFDKALS